MTAFQLKKEQEWQERGSQRYFNQQDKLEIDGKGDRTDAAQKLLRESITAIAEHLELLANQKLGGIGAKYNRVLRTAAGPEEDWMKVAYIGFQAAFQGLYKGKDARVGRLVHQISTRLEMDMKCMIFEDAYPAYFNKIKQSFDEDQVESYTHKHKVMNLMFERKELEWEPWGAVMRVQMGTRVLRAVLYALSEFLTTQIIHERNKKYTVITTTVGADEWIATLQCNTGLSLPYLLPSYVKPIDWELDKTTGTVVGGYYTTALQRSVPFVKAYAPEHLEFIGKNVEQLTPHVSAVNSMQATSWKVNTRVWQVQQDLFAKGFKIGIPSSARVELPKCPENPTADELRAWKGCAKQAHRAEKKRKGDVIAYQQTRMVAQEYEDVEAFYFVYSCDFRGRIYCATPAFSPQGSDNAKGLLQFAEGKPLGESGIYWLAIQGANTWGNDKVSYDDRVDFIYDMAEDITRITSDPIGNRSLWARADKPYQFLAFCFEWADCQYGYDKQALSSIPVGLDGSCNGLQHYSAILKDEVGGGQVNLTPGTFPQDIYQKVADVCLDKIQNDGSSNARRWCKIGITRKCAKRPVMTLPYGSTQQSCRQYITDYVMDHKAQLGLEDMELWEMAKYLTPILWASIGEVVIAARTGMDWIQTQARRSAKHGNIKWMSPVGFPVFQRYMKMNSVRVKTQLLGEIFVNASELTDEINVYKQANSIAPNFVHSVDAAHMVMSINATDYSHYAMIHDDYGTHAAYAEDFQLTIREQFVQLHEKNLLQHWAEQQPITVNSFPAVGELDLQLVLESDYFFG